MNSSNLTSRNWDDHSLVQAYNTAFPESSSSNNTVNGSLRFFASHGRSELGGNHTDHNQGKVIAAALDLPVLAAVQARSDTLVRVVSQGWNKEFTVDLQMLDPIKEEQGTTLALIRGVACGIVKAGFKIGGFNAYIQSWVTPGSGLSSSAAMEILLGVIFNGLFNQGQIKLIDLAKTGQQAENLHFGKPCGLMDQLSCAYGGVISIDFKNSHLPQISEVVLDLTSWGLNLVILDTGGSHVNLTDEYAAIPKEMKSVARELGVDVLGDANENMFWQQIPFLKDKLSHRAILRSMHFFQENHRVDALLQAIKDKNSTQFLKQVRQSGQSSAIYLQNLYPTSHVESQRIVLALGMAEAFLGDTGASRVHGGGFAGTIQSYVPLERIDGFVYYMEKVFGQGCAHVLSILNQKAGEILPMEG